MCGACGSGRGLPRWEDRLEPATRRVLAARAAVADRLLGHGRLRVTAWGSGYQVGDGRGRTLLAADLDELWRACGSGAGPIRWPVPASDDETGIAVELDPEVTADRALVAVWSAYVARLAPLPGPLQLLLPDPDRGRTLDLSLRSSGVAVIILPTVRTAAVLSGTAARAAAVHLHLCAQPADERAGSTAGR